MSHTRIVQAVFALFLMILLLSAATPCRAAQQTRTLTVAGPIWFMDDNPPPETFWSPWLPMPTQAVIRYALGLKVSLGAVAVRCPVKLTIRYDDAQAKGGETLTLHVKAEPAPAVGTAENQRTFDAGFGIEIPNKLQAGFVSITGIPDILPWVDLPLDLWGLIKLLPGDVPGYITAALENLGVFMDSTAACPLGASAEYHDARDVFSFDLKKLIVDADPPASNQPNAPKKPKDAATRLWEKIPKTVKESVKRGIKFAAMVNDATAQERAIDYIADGLSLITSAGEIAVNADPFWKVEGEKLMVLLRYHVPNRMCQGSMPLYFTGPNQEQTLEIPVPDFVTDANVLEVLLDEVEYTFKLYQGLGAGVTFSSLVHFELAKAAELVRYPQARAEYTENNAIWVPLTQSDKNVVNYRARGGFNSLIVYFSSPAMPIKATAHVYKGTQLVKSVAESSPRMVHDIIVGGLEQDTAYTVKLSYVDSMGVPYEHDETAACRTKAGTYQGGQTTRLANDDESMTPPVVTPHQTTADFSWTSTCPGTTFVYISPLDDFNLYTSAIKHESGEVSYGDCTSVESGPALETNHSITVPDLEPGTTYQYYARTYYYTGSDLTSDHMALGYRGSFTTQAAPQPPQAEVRVVCNGVVQNGVPVQVSKMYPLPSAQTNLTTVTNGFTPTFGMTPGADYKATVSNQACWLDKSTTWKAPNTAGTTPTTVALNLTPRPHPGGRVVDEAGDPIAGATVSSNKFSPVQTDAQGRFVPAGAPTPGTYTLSVLKSGYLPGTMTATVDDCRLVTADTAVLVPNSAPVAVRVLQGSGQPVPNARVSICPKGQTSCAPSGQTNGQGLFNASVQFSANETLERTINAVPQGNAATSLQPSRQDAALVPGMAASVEIYLPPQPPSEISAFSAGQAGNAIQVQVSSPDVVWAALDYVGPGNQTVNQPFPTTNNGRDHTLRIANCVSGEYKVRAKIKNVAGRESASDWETVRYWTAADWDFHAGQTGADQIAVAWRPYEGAKGFKSYVLTVNGQNPVTVSNQSTMEKLLSNLPLGQALTVGIHAVDKEGNAITETGQTTITLANQPPVIGQVVLDPASIPLDKEAMLTAVVTDEDSKLQWVRVLGGTGKPLFEKKNASSPVNVKAKVTGKAPGDQVFTIQASDGSNTVEATATLHVVRIAPPEFKAVEAPSQAEILKEWKARFQVLNTDRLSGSLTLAATWDKEQPEVIALPATALETGTFELTRSLETTGSHRVELTLTAEAEGLSFTSKPVKVTVKAVENPPQLALACSGDGPDKVFHVTITPGSVDIDHWTLDFGDKSLSPSVAGPAGQDVPHTYQAPPGKKLPTKATATLTAWDVRGKEYKASLRVSISAPADQQSSRDEVGADLSLSSRLPSKAVAGQEKDIKAVVKNRSKQDLERIQVVLLVNNAEADNQKLELKAGKSGEVHFAFTPQEPGEAELILEVRPPEGMTDPEPDNNQVSKTVTVSAP